MPLVFRLDHEARLIVTAGYGTLTDDEVFGYLRQIGSLEDAIGYDELVDMTHVMHIAVPLTNRVGDVAPDDLAFGLGRMFQTRREMEPGSTTEVGVFRTMEAALAFLRVDHPLDLPTLD